MADDVLMDGVRGVTDLSVNPGLINLDFADVVTVTKGAGRAMMGTGIAAGEGRASKAVTAALGNPLLSDLSISGARGVLISISGGQDLTLFEVDEIASKVRDQVGNDDADIIFGSTFDEKLNGSVKVSVIVTGIGSPNTFSPAQTMSGSMLAAASRSNLASAISEDPTSKMLKQKLSSEHVAEESKPKKLNFFRRHW
jgi:cell division protein FtsZ